MRLLQCVLAIVFISGCAHTAPESETPFGVRVEIRRAELSRHGCLRMTVDIKNGGTGEIFLITGKNLPVLSYASESNKTHVRVGFAAFRQDRVVVGDAFKDLFLVVPGEEVEILFYVPIPVRSGFDPHGGVPVPNVPHIEEAPLPLRFSVMVGFIAEGALSSHGASSTSTIAESLAQALQSTAISDEIYVSPHRRSDEQDFDCLQHPRGGALGYEIRRSD